MACYIFLKSLSSLEEFRKIPHVKNHPKSPSTNFQSLGKFKNPILNRKFLFFLIFAPADPAARLASGPASPPAAPSLQAEIARPAHPARASVASSWEIRFPFRLMPSEPAASPSSICQPGPICQMCLPHRAGRPRPLSSMPSSHPTPPDLRPRDARQDNYPAP
jgi:hypothetical protein